MHRAEFALIMAVSAFVCLAAAAVWAPDAPRTLQALLLTSLAVVAAGAVGYARRRAVRRLQAATTEAATTRADGATALVFDCLELAAARRPALLARRRHSGIRLAGACIHRLPVDAISAVVTSTSVRPAKRPAWLELLGTSAFAPTLDLDEMRLARRFAALPASVADALWDTDSVVARMRGLDHPLDEHRDRVRRAREIIELYDQLGPEAAEIAAGLASWRSYWRRSELIETCRLLAAAAPTAA